MSWHTCSNSMHSECPCAPAGTASHTDALRSLHLTPSGMLADLCQVPTRVGLFTPLHQRWLSGMCSHTGNLNPRRPAGSGHPNPLPSTCLRPGMAAPWQPWGPHLTVFSSPAGTYQGQFTNACAPRPRAQAPERASRMAVVVRRCRASPPAPAQREHSNGTLAPDSPSSPAADGPALPGPPSRAAASRSASWPTPRRRGRPWAAACPRERGALLGKRRAESRTSLGSQRSRELPQERPQLGRQRRRVHRQRLGEGADEAAPFEADIDATTTETHMGE